jgi:hypothetical protein
LFRTPISGGVHSATSAHDLPPPALAVRNLMEQVMQANAILILVSSSSLPPFLLYVFIYLFVWMNQARFAHLSTTMSKMHHRRAGYPFGSLVDFAPDSMGRTFISRFLLLLFISNKKFHLYCT